MGSSNSKPPDKKPPYQKPQGPQGLKALPLKTKAQPVVVSVAAAARPKPRQFAQEAGIKLLPTDTRTFVPIGTFLGSRYNVQTERREVRFGWDRPADPADHALRGIWECSSRTVGADWHEGDKTPTARGIVALRARNVVALDWDALEGTILRALAEPMNGMSRWSAWHAALELDDQRRFSNPKKTAESMLLIIKRQVAAANGVERVP
jgi:hypothetical protein